MPKYTKILSFEFIKMIDYIPKFSKLPKQFLVLEILWKRGATSSRWTNKQPTEAVEVFPIYQDRIYSDLITIDRKIQALKLTWDDDTAPTAPSKNLIVFIPDALLKEPTEILEHVLFEFVSSLFPFKDRRIILTHEDDQPHPTFDRLLSLFKVVVRAKNLAMTPANIATPIYLAKYILQMGRKIPGVKTTFMDAKALKKKGFGLITAIGESAATGPCMVVLTRPGATGSKTLALIGKGVSFDSGGLSIKSFEGMYDMKYDKIGAVYMAHVFDLLARDEALKKHHLVAVLPFAENAVSHKAVHPGDVIRSYSGKTVEISDPDAEGRLLLADALAYSAVFKPDIVFDLATLTGHADSINCWHRGYAYCQPESMRVKLEKLTNKIGERMLSMPNWTEYATVLRSDMADLINSPNACSDAFTAALFLREFLPESATTWIHVDLAHEFDDHVPKGNGIRTFHALAHQILSS